VVPGKTRIFLVHRGGEKTADRGKIFGYFVLRRVEVLSRLRHPVPSPDVEVHPWSGPAGQGKLSVMVYDATTGRQIRAVQARAMAAPRLPVKARVGTTGRHDFVVPQDRYDLEVSLPGFAPTRAPGIEVASTTRRNVSLYLKPQRNREKEIRQKCWDGSEIVTHRFHNGRWHRTDKKCPELPEPAECADGEVVWQFCPDGQPIPKKLCLGGEWVATGLECQPPPRQPPPGGDGGDGDQIPIDDEVFAHHRSCSLRLRPGAVYLVDALCAEITAAFSRAMAGTTIKDAYRRAPTDAERQASVHKGRELFRTVVDEVHKGRLPRTRLPPELEAKALLHGELVVFAQPAVFVKGPRAAFRSLERIDGDQLLEQIAGGVRVPTIRIWAQAGKTKSLTRRQLVARLAGTQRLSLAIVNRFLDELAALAKTQISLGADLELPLLGTLRPTLHAARNPLSKPDLAAAVAAAMSRKGVEAEGGVPDLALSAPVVERLLDNLADLVTGELEGTGVLRLPRLGTFRRTRTDVTFLPARVLRVESLEFRPSARIHAAAFSSGAR